MAQIHGDAGGTPAFGQQVVGSPLGSVEAASTSEAPQPAFPRELPFETHPMTVFGLYAKRTLDVALSSLLLLLLSPLWLVIAIAIRLDTPGPVIFRQPRAGARPVRVGRRLRWETTTFEVLKFRTMYANADQTLHGELVRAYARGAKGAGPDPEAPYKLTNDPRITRVGKVLRRLSLDELPQLVNVLRGEMSLVGPRPLPLYEVAEYQPWHYERLCALPGITGLWQVEGRGRTSFDEATLLDIEYVRGWSLGLDLKLLLRTLPAVLSRKGAG